MCSLPERWQKKTAVGAARDYFFDVWWRQAFTALVYAGFPIDRGRGGTSAIDKARELVDEGWSIVVFPEGTRSQDGHMQRFRHGASRLAIELGVGVVPIAIVGAYQAMPKGRFWPKAGRPVVTMRYGPPIYPEEGESHQSLSAPDAAGGDGAVRRGSDELVRRDVARRAQGDALARGPARRRLATHVGGLAAGAPPRPAEDLGVACREPVASGGAPRSSRRRSASSAREGYAGASLDSIAQAVGVRKQTLLYYFPNKDALLEACLAAAGQRVAEEIASALEGSDGSGGPRRGGDPRGVRARGGVAGVPDVHPRGGPARARTRSIGSAGALEPLRLRAIGVPQGRHGRPGRSASKTPRCCCSRCTPR